MPIFAVYRNGPRWAASERRKSHSPVRQRRDWGSLFAPSPRTGDRKFRLNTYEAGGIEEPAEAG